jgi:hypothetical protein
VDESVIDEVTQTEVGILKWYRNVLFATPRLRFHIVVGLAICAHNQNCHALKSIYYATADLFLHHMTYTPLFWVIIVLRAYL